MRAFFRSTPALITVNMWALTLTINRGLDSLSLSCLDLRYQSTLNLCSAPNWKSSRSCTASRPIVDETDLIYAVAGQTIPQKVVTNALTSEAAKRVPEPRQAIVRLFPKALLKLKQLSAN